MSKGHFHLRKKTQQGGRDERRDDRQRMPKVWQKKVGRKKPAKRARAQKNVFKRGALA